jgi:hypothetical protein
MSDVRITAIVKVTESYEVDVPLSVLAQVLGLTEEEIRDAVYEGDSSDYDRIAEFLIEQAPSSIYAMSTGNDDAEMEGEPEIS